MSYSAEWTAAPFAIGTLLILLIVPSFALIALAVLALAALVALVALAGLILASPYLLVRTVHRRLAERQIPQPHPLPAAAESVVAT